MSDYISASVDVSGTLRCCCSLLSSYKAKHPTRFEPSVSRIFLHSYRASW